MNCKVLFVLIFILVIVGTVWAFVKPQQSYESEVFSPNGVAIHGYDPVSFIDDSVKIKGIPALNYKWLGVDWYFSSETNLVKFKQSPEKYIPAYGGYCAFGVSRGYKASTEIDTWTLHEGKLYFNYNQRVKNSWMKGQQQYIQQADKNWLGIKNKNTKS